MWGPPQQALSEAEANPERNKTKPLNSNLKPSNLIPKSVNRKRSPGEVFARSRRSPRDDGSLTGARSLRISGALGGRGGGGEGFFYARAVLEGFHKAATAGGERGILFQGLGDFFAPQVCCRDFGLIRCPTGVGRMRSSIPV